MPLSRHQLADHRTSSSPYAAGSPSTSTSTPTATSAAARSFSPQFLSGNLLSSITNISSNPSSARATPVGTPGKQQLGSVNGIPAHVHGAGPGTSVTAGFGGGGVAVGDAHAGGGGAGSVPTPFQEMRMSLEVVRSEMLPWVERLGEEVFDGIDRAFEPDVDPLQTEAKLRELLFTIQFLSAYCRGTGIGSIPVFSEDSDRKDSSKDSPSPRQIQEEAEALAKAARAKFDERQRVAEGAAVVSSILSTAGR